MEGALGERLKREYRLAFNPYVAMANLIYHAEGKKALKSIWSEYIEIACHYKLPFLATTPTRRANQERIHASSYDQTIISDNVSFLREIQKQSQADMFIGGLMGCKGDAYKATDILSIPEARSFHSWQANLFKEVEVDFLFAGIMPALSEAIGMAQAMSDTGRPYIISFMLLRNGRLIDGTSIHDAIYRIDNETKIKPVCYMSNCIHPTILYEALSQPFNQTPLVKERFLGIQANTSPLSPEELDDADDLQCTDPNSLATEIIRLRNEMHLKIFGGCCGTDKTHIEEIARKL